MLHRFDRTTFLQACHDYHTDYEPPFGDEPVYQLFVLNPQDLSPGPLAARAVTYLDLWKGYNFRYEKEGLRRAREYLPEFFENSRIRRSIRTLRSRHLESLKPSDFSHVHELMSTLLDELAFDPGKGRPRQGAATPAGKLLHFLAPHAVVMWDSDIIRTRAYGIGDSADDYVGYQRFCQRVLWLLSGSGRDNALGDIARRHSVRCHLSYIEPLPKLLDEMAYYKSGRIAKRAARAVAQDMGVSPDELWDRLRER